MEKTKKSRGGAAKIIIIIFAILFIIGLSGYFVIRWVIGQAGERVFDFVSEMELEEEDYLRMMDSEWIETIEEDRGEPGMPSRISGRETILPTPQGAVMYNHSDLTEEFTLVEYAVRAPADEVIGFYKNALKDREEKFVSYEGAYADGFYTFETEETGYIITIDHYRGDESITNINILAEERFFEQQ